MMTPEKGPTPKGIYWTVFFVFGSPCRMTPMLSILAPTLSGVFLSFHTRPPRGEVGMTRVNPTYKLKIKAYIIVF